MPLGAVSELWRRMTGMLFERPSGYEGVIEPMFRNIWFLNRSLVICMRTNSEVPLERFAICMRLQNEYHNQRATLSCP